ncbi:winged helix DNA-binding domain-containing protein [Phycicoccus flavus]|uniref:winged helix DNA-binding domain-containing protein n=1 Tax=Phycicoccus flavus TaxID=2502783 RepID=UPI000FEB5F43|nr:winged helix DNA-binding domain-containing protein [Phycicoccus flavus]NHA68967.1 winged helix DNA-binding domain-containing protein [Phycicoccus flavus]NHA69992.1 winged helix DNA-binding domain-containing protein [Phycicoccus flavus]
MSAGIDDRAVARWRFRTLLLDGASAPDAASAVRSLLAVQAENPEQTGWALASRTRGLTPAGLRGLLASGELVRTHVLRPTWHLVHREDLRWLLELTGPRVRRQAARQLDRDLGLDAAAVTTLTDVVVRALTDAPDLTREGLARAVAAAGHEVSGTQLMVLLVHLELGLLVAGGRPVPDDGVGTHTYRVLGDDLPASPYADRDEALDALVRRYVAGHGPVTERDLAYWATLTLGDVRRGLASAGADLASFEHDGRSFWHLPDQEPPPPSSEPQAHLLHLLDEWYRGYQDSRRVVDTAGRHPAGREPSMGLAVVDAQIAGTAARTTRPGRVTFEVAPYGRLSAAERRALEAEARRYGTYTGRDAEVRWASAAR